MFDANSTVCTSVHSASLDIYAPQEVEIFSACKITETHVFHSIDEGTFAVPAATVAAAAAAAGAASASPGGLPTPVVGGLYDRRLGSLDGREPCATCGCRSDCPGHPGHVQLALPIFQPALLPSLVKILKFTCLYCGRLRISAAVSSLMIKAFELLQLGRFEELQRVIEIAVSSLRTTPAARSTLEGECLPFSAGQRAALCRAFRILEEAENAASLADEGGDAECEATVREHHHFYQRLGGGKDLYVKEETGERASSRSAASEEGADLSASTRKRGATAAPAPGEAEGQPEQDRRHKARLFLQKLDIGEAEDERLTHFNEDVSQSAWQVSAWRHLRRLLWTRVLSTTVCPNCGRSCSATFHVAQRSVAVEMRWKWTGKPPFDRKSVFFSSLHTRNSRQATEDGPAGASAAVDVEDDAKDLFNERCLTYGKSGQAIGKMQLHAFQLRPLMERLFSHRLDRLLLQCLLPVSTRLASSCFFISTLPVPASNFRPPAAGAAFQRGGGRSMPVLHPRTATLLDLLKINERVLLAVNVMKHPDPIGALEDPSRLMELFAGQPVGSVAGTGSKQSLSAVLTVQEQQRVKEFVMVHAAGNATWLPTYSAQLQRKVNEIVDQTKAENPATASPGIRQWLEKKEGAIRQKMMGKRVNFAARTVLAPDGLIATNEIGVPLEFAMKLYIPEPVTPRNAHLLAAMVINGPFRHPGAVSVKDAAGNVFVLEYLSPAARQAKARQILAAIQPSAARGLSAGSRTGGGGGAESSFTVYRHVLDGDVVLMNRQPSLHRLSLMGHFVRISRGACSWYDVNDYLLRNGMQHKLVEKQSGSRPAGPRVAKKENREAGKNGSHQDSGGRVSLIHYWRRFRKGAEGAESSTAQKSEATRKDADSADGFTKEDVFRLNFVNCSSYNADFDGDEMNMHLPQDLMARTEAAYLMNADCHFLVPKDGGPMRGLIQDFCLAGCMLTARDTFFTADMFHTLVYSGLSCYIDSREDTVVLDRGRGQGRLPLGPRNGRGESAVAGGDPYRRRLLAGNTSGERAKTGEGSRLVIVPPAIVWPQKLWTGKQVITCVLKTLVDGIATKRLAQVQVKSGDGIKDAVDERGRRQVCAAAYRGINLTSKAKTPGDAWGGVEDGDTEEERVIIQESELLQGVFDKAQFGSNAGGLLHCVFILLGSAAAGLLLQSLAALFCAFLKLRGATACPGDFVMRRKGEFERKRLAERIVQAGTYLQEHFTARLNNLMGWTETEEGSGSLGGTEECKVAVKSAACSPGISVGGEVQSHRRADDVGVVLRPCRKDLGGENAQSKCEALLQMISNAGDTPVEQFNKEMTKSSSTLKGVPAHEVHLERLRLARLADAVCTLLKIGGQIEEEKGTNAVAFAKQLTSEHGSAGSTQLQYKESQKDAKQFLCKKSQAGAMCLSSWILTRLQRLPLVAAGKLITATSAALQLQKFVLMLKTLSEGEDETGRAWLARLQETSPKFTQQLLRLAQDRQGDSSVRRQAEAHAAAPTRSVEVSPDLGDVQLLPVPSTLVCLPNGGFIQGDPSLLQTRLYHPSWLWNAGRRRAADVAAAQVFEKIDRYILQAAERASVTSGNVGIRTFSIPSKLTQQRIGSLYRNHFLGRKEMFNEMLDAFFQSAIGKVASASTDIMDGSSFLYRFPQNGFAGMIKSGSKGSNINFAMISVFLGQQSLEGRRVKNMPSDRSLPSFGPYDFGSRARGFITSSFLSGLKEEEYFFHCMAGREGLVDTAVKTAKSGYLQRSVIKSMEALTVRYDGSVRDADDSVIQFVYGDDGRDPMHRSTFEKITCLLENPDLLRCVSPVSPDIAAGNAAERKELFQYESVKEDEIEDIEGPVSPLSHVGITCPKFERDSVELISKVLKERRRVRSFHSNSSMDRTLRKTKVNAAKQKHNRLPSISAGSCSKQGLDVDAEEESTRAELQTLLKLLYHKCLAPPGEAVGCVAAQSIGEPATQMTLNTFHLAGHGAANVTMGIPRLRELLQQGGATKTPVIYVPLRSRTNLVDGDGRVLTSEISESATLAQNAATALRGFTTINLAACVHSVGVETKVCYQSPYCLEGCPAFHLPPYTKSTAASWTAPFSRLYWQYDVCIQMENLSHFVQVVPTYSQAEVCLAVLKKVIRTFLKKVSRLMVASVAHYGRAGSSAARNDMQSFFQLRICQDNRLNSWHYRQKVKEILRTARVATGTAEAGEATTTDSFVGGSVSRSVVERKDGADDEQEGQHRQSRDADAAGEKKNSADEDDEEEERSEAEEEEDGSEDGKTRSPDEADGVEGLWTSSQEKKSGRRKERKLKDSHNAAEGGVVAAEEAEIESHYTDSESESRLSGESSGESGPEEERVAEDAVDDKVALQTAAGSPRSNRRTFASNNISVSKRSSPLLLSFAELLRGKEFNLRTHLFEAQLRTDDTSVSTPSADPSLKGDALWENGRRHRGAVLITREVASILQGISVCPRTWRMVVKFGWPMEKCPYRLEVLPMLRNLLQKSYIQRPEGVAAPRIVQGEGCALGQESELQCEGSNIQWIHQMKEEAIDHAAIRTNDVRAMLKHYGVEAARVCLVKELEKVFSAYGIKVDYRHLALIADFMTHDGGIRPFNRSGIAASNAPFLQMSYETSFKFLTEACERAATDSLSTPSGGLIVGTPATVGSGQCEIYTQLGSVAGCSS